MQVFAGRKIESPSLFIAGRSDWGIFQVPGAIDRMRTTACADMRDVVLIQGAGHWVQQEKPDEVNAALLRFLGTQSHSA
jgi:pimeloyl-ACP methyl ester carboxylesterase